MLHTYITCLFITLSCLLQAQGTVKGKLYFRQRANNPQQVAAKGSTTLIYPAGGIRVILIDRNNRASQAALRSVERPHFDCDASLNGSNAQTTYTNSEGVYYFRRVPQGKYVLRVCTHSGTYHYFIINRSSTYYLVSDLEATRIRREDVYRRVN